MSVVVVTQPTNPIPSLDEVKAHLRARDFTDDDNDILSKIWGAITEFEDPNLGWLGASVIAREVQYSADQFETCITLPLGPVLIDDDHPLTIVYDDEDGAEQKLEDTVYRLLEPEGLERRLVLKAGQSWPATYDQEQAVRITYWTGYAADDIRVNNFKSAVKLHVQMTYDGETETDRNLKETIARLLQPYRSMFV